MSSQSFSSYLSQAASSNNFTTDVSWLSTFFPAFDITPTSAQMSGVNLVIKGQLNISNNDLPFGSAITGFSALTSFLPTFSVTQDFTLTIMPATGKDQNQITASLVLPISGNYSMTIPGSSKKTPSLSGVSVTITVVDSDPPTASFGIGGTMDMTLYQNQTVSVKAAASFTVSNDEVTAIQINVLDTFSEPLKSPEILGNRLTLDKIGVSVGVNFEPPGCLVGIEGSGTITTPNNTIQVEKAAIVCDVEGDVPIPLYLGLQAQQLDLSDFMGIVGQEFPVPDVPITFNNPSMYYCKQGVTLPDGTVVAQGFSVKSEVDLFGENFYGSCTYANDQSISGTFQTDGPLTLADTFTLSGNAQGTLHQAGIDNFSLPSNQQEWQDWQKETGGTVGYKPGGAYFSVNLSRNTSNPSLVANLELKFLGEYVTSLVTSADQNGLHLSFDIPAFSFKGTFTVANGAITGSFKSWLGNDLPLPYDAGMKSLGSLTGAQYFNAELSPGGGPIPFTSVNSSTKLDGTIIDIVQNGSWSYSSFWEMLQQLAHQPESIISALYKNSSIWMTAVSFGVIAPDSSVTDKAKFAIEGMANFGLLPGYTGIGKGSPVNVFPQYMANMHNSLGFSPSDFTNALSNFNDYHEPPIYMAAADAGKIAISIGKNMSFKFGFGYSEIASALHLGSAFNASMQDLATVFNYAETAVSDAATAMESVFPGEEKAIGEALKGAGYAAETVWNEFKSLGGDFATAAEKVASAIGSAFNPANW